MRRFRPNRWVMSAAFGGLLLALGVASFVLTRELRETPAAEAQPPPVTNLGRGPWPPGTGPTPTGTPPPPVPPAGHPPLPPDLPGPVQPALPPDPRGPVQPALPPDPRGPLWYVPLVEADLKKPRADGEYNGIYISMHARYEPPCGWDTAQGIELDGRGGSTGDALDAGSVVELRPAYLPEGSSLSGRGVATCSSEAVVSGANYEIPPRGSPRRFGGDIQIRRMVGRPIVGTSIATEDRLRLETLLGRPAVVMPPLTEDGFGDSLVALREPWGVTYVTASGITEAELLRVVVGIYREGGVQ